MNYFLANQLPAMVWGSSTPARIGLSHPVCGALLVIVIASVNFLFNLGDPPAPFWDESYYLTSTERYAEGIAQFASHPPLGLMLIAAGDVALHPNRELNTRPLAGLESVPGNRVPPGFDFSGVRLASGLFAVLGAIAFYGLMYALTESTFAALAFGNLFVLENAFVTQFRAAQLDAFQIAFAVLALWCFTAAVKRGERRSLLLDCGLAAASALAMLVKMNAAVLLLLCLMLILWRLTRRWSLQRPTTAILAATRESLAMLVTVVVVMLSVFSIHVLISRGSMDPHTAAGQKDLTFLSPTYAEYLQGTRPFSPRVLASAAQDYQRFMAADFTHTPLQDPNGSHPWEWPLHHGTITYRWDSDGVKTAYVQLVGNAAGWFLAFIAPFAAAGLLLLRAGSPSESGASWRRALMLMLLLEYVAFLALHGYLGTQRVMYLYHYFIGLLIAFALLPLVLREVEERVPAIPKRRGPVLATLTVILAMSFVFYAPLNFHRPITHTQCEWRNLFQHVIDCQ